MRPHTTTPRQPCACGCGLIPVDARSKWRKGHHRTFVQGIPFNATKEEAFWLAVDKTLSCWLWKGPLDQDGYGHFHWAGEPGIEIAHRYAWTITNGAIPGGLLVLHSCDVNYPPGDTTNRRCVRPDHLHLGTNIDNTRERDEKNRTAKAERAGTAKLNRENVTGIRTLTEQGYNDRQIAPIFNISPDTVRQVRTEETWRSIPWFKAPKPIKPPVVRKPKNPKVYKLTRGMVQEIQALTEEYIGLYPSPSALDRALATQFGVHPRTIHDVREGKIKGRE